MLAPEYSKQIVSLQPDLSRFIHTRRRQTCVHTPEAEDEVQEVLTEIMRSVPHYRSELGEFRAWAFGIAINVHRKFARYQKRHNNRFSEDLLNADEHEAPGPSPERWTQIRQARVDIEHVTRGMNPKQYIALYLIVFEGQSHEEIASEMNISVSSSKQLVHRAREYLAKHGIDEETFFSMPPLKVEIRQDERERSVFLRKHYDWFFRVGNAVSLLGALTFAAPVKPIEFARAWLSAHLSHITAHITADVGKPAFSSDEPAHSFDVAPAFVAERGHKEVIAPIRHLDKRSSAKVRVTVEGVTLLPRKTR